PWLVHERLDIIVKSGKLGSDAIVVDLKDYERALVWIDHRFARLLDSGLYALWTSEHDIRVEVIDTHAVQLVHSELAAILRAPEATALLEVLVVAAGHAGVWFRDGAHQATLGPGTYAFWKGAGKLTLHDVDLKEQVLDIGGQEIMTAVEQPAQALYRAAQLALREAVGAKDLDALLASKDVLALELASALGVRAAELGMTVVSAGVRD